MSDLRALANKAMLDYSIDAALANEMRTALRTAADEIDALWDNLHDRETIISNAPHDEGCIGWFRNRVGAYHDGTCDCWKAEL